MITARGITKNKRICFLVKSDRINALRKQYDAFLEEDKRRKERNDFILGRLDKMRYTTALVPVRHKLSAFEIRPAIVNHPGFQPESSSDRDFQSSITNQRQQLLPDMQAKNNEESYLFQEISKNYILIPKLRTVFINPSYGATIQNPDRLQNSFHEQDTVPIKELNPNYHENNDWKSKYEILNILKSEEKGKTAGNDQTGLEQLKQSGGIEISLPNSKNQATINYDNDNYVNTDVTVDTSKRYENEFPEKDLSADIVHYDIPQESKHILKNTIHATENLVTNTDTSENNVLEANVEQTDAICNELQNITLKYEHSEAPNVDVSGEIFNIHEEHSDPDVNINSTVANVYSKQSDETINVQDEYPVETGSVIYDQNVSIEQHEPADLGQTGYVDNYEINPMQALDYNSPSTLGVNDGILENERSMIREMSNDQEFAAPNRAIQIKQDVTDVPQEQTYFDSNIETVEQIEPVIENEENQANISESIDDFEAEQREMFYSEQTDNYPQHGDQEHPADFSQNELSQNQEYAYYENTAEAYPAQNDEEVTQQYDPSYDQQYTGLDQGSEQEQYGEQYQVPERYTDQIEPQFEDLQYEQQFESRQEIENTLDAEDGYTAVKPQDPAGEIPREEKSEQMDKSHEKKMEPSN